eukprot:TRINITY_DN6683_c0_g1_i2.p1 TRINITY_DN6683_c0_g1~~TRINITY_DN6683_c0_g1_i2.p1  ORF type:complete len:236 (-),score=54.96 TRINITY_DN6683_c0_g1_i2:445-1152(-)
MAVLNGGENGGEEDNQVFNFGTISEWYSRGTDYAFFLNLVRIGDRLEFKRNGYCHWAVFVGIQYVVLEEDGPHVLLPCIVHRNNPADDPALTGGGAGQPGAVANLFSGFSSSTRLSSKGAYGIGDVCLEPLREAWGESKIRINNSLDHTKKPLSSHKVVERLMSVLDGKGSMSKTPYNVATNNCEHFASWARNDWALSTQVIKAGVPAVIYLWPANPILACIALFSFGYQAIKKI